MKRIFLIVALIVLGTSILAWSQVPATLSYQGMLTSAEGALVPDGNVELTFQLYEAAEGETPIWSESQSVVVIKGMFNAILGGSAPLDLPFDKQYWLGIKIGENEEMSQRIPFMASPYSLKARSVTDGAITGSSIADGAVVRSINSIKDNVTIEAGENIRITEVDNTLTISAIAGPDLRKFTGKADRVGGDKLQSSFVNTLDAAYDQGGPGAGRTITADAGAVNIAGTDGLVVSGIALANKFQLPGNGFWTEDANSNFTFRTAVGRSMIFDFHNSLQFRKKDAVTAFPRFFIDINGDVGINTTTPSAKLDVVGNSEFNGDVVINSNLDVDGGTLQVDGAGDRVGVGGASATTKFVVRGTTEDNLIEAYNDGAGAAQGLVFRVERATGNVYAEGTFNPSGADVAEFVNTTETVEPGDVIEIDPYNPGHFRKTQDARSRRVAGIITTDPGVVLGYDLVKNRRHGAYNPAVALAGRVPVKVMARYGSIEIGDLLVSSPFPGYAMKCANTSECVGAIIGKAMEPLEAGTGKIMVQVMLR